MKDCQEAVKIVKECENIIKTNKKNIISFVYKQGKTKFKNLVEIKRSTIIFKINIVKLADKYPKMLTSSVTLNFLKSYHKDIKRICKENPELNVLL